MRNDEMENNVIQNSVFLYRYLFHAAISDIIEAIRISSYEKVSNDISFEVLSSKKRYVHELKELSTFLGCSPVTAQKIKSSGIFRCSYISAWSNFNS